ncbi:MAG: sigma-70 family RNA polymerase sigma factor [Bacteroidota bacterium]
MDKDLREWIKGCKRNNREAQRSLYDRMLPLALKISIRYANDEPESLDIVHDAFIRIFKYIKNFNPRKGNFEAWVRQIVINVALKKKQQNRLCFPELDQKEGVFPEVQPSILAQLHAQDLLNLIQALPEGYRVIFNLSVVEGYAHEEIAELLGISESTSRSQLTRAKRKVQALLKQQKALEHDGQEK